MTPADLFPHAKSAHVRVARMLGDTLTLGAVEDWAAFGVVLRAKLTPRERRGLAWGALRACDPDEAEAVARIVIPNLGAGPPDASLRDPIEEAVDWAKDASPQEVKAYLFACFLSLSKRDQARFLKFAQRRVSA